MRVISISFLILISSSKFYPIEYGPISINIYSDSTLKSKNNSYMALNMVDYNKSTAWIEGNQGLDGKFEFIINRPVELIGFKYIPGYIKSKDTFYNNAVCRDFKVIANGVEQYVVTATRFKLRKMQYDEGVNIEQDRSHPDNYDYQFVIINPLECSNFTIQLGNSIYTKYQDNGFTEFHPIYKIHDTVYAGKDEFRETILLLTNAENENIYHDKIEVPAQDLSEIKKYNLKDGFRFGDRKKTSYSDLMYYENVYFDILNKTFRIKNSHYEFIDDYITFEDDSIIGDIIKTIYFKNYKIIKVDYMARRWKK